MAVIDFADLQAGYRQVSKGDGLASENQIRFVVGGDGKPRTTHDMLEQDLDGQKERKPAAVRFKEDKYGYRLKPYLGRVNGRTKWGKTINNRTTRRSHVGGLACVRGGCGDDRQTLGWLLGLYKNSDRFGELSAKSQKDYASAIEKLTEAPVGNDRFGNVQLDQVDKRSIQSYLDTYPSPVAANRHIAVLKSARNWVLERHEVPDNPHVRCEPQSGAAERAIRHG